MKRILTIQDVSCVGKCSLTVALPIISACGIETAILPTAVLSNHTMFKSWTFRDLTDDMDDIAKKWKEENIDFDSLYTGYLGSADQIEKVKALFKDFKKQGGFTVVDPVMADNGKLYPGFDLDFVKKMTTLCAVADYIVPNLTEASFILGVPYPTEYDEEYIKDMLIKLTDLGAKKALLTGVTFEKGKLGAYGYDCQTKEFFYYYNEHLPVNFHGTGDVFASTLTGALTLGKSFLESTKVAVDYTVQTIRETMKNPDHNFYGVDFETAIPYLIERIK